MANHSDGSAANLGFENEFWQAADALRSNMDAAEYKRVVLGLIFLKYISDAFDEHHAHLVKQRDQGADPEDPDEYRARETSWALEIGMNSVSPCTRPGTAAWKGPMASPLSGSQLCAADGAFLRGFPVSSPGEAGADRQNRLPAISACPRPGYARFPERGRTSLCSQPPHVLRCPVDVG
jgi:hypothetical protein